MAEAGRVLIVSCTSLLSSLDAIKQIIGNNELPKSVKTTDHLESFPWVVKNKYFVANIELCHGENCDIFKLFLEITNITFEAIIMIFDQGTKETLQLASDYLKILKAYNSSVQLLLNAGEDSEVQQNDALSKAKVLEWCLEHSFELVELNASDDEQETEHFGAQTGFPRVIQALNCGEWPNIKLNPGITKETQSQAANGSTATEIDNEKKGDQNTHQISETELFSENEAELLQRLTLEEPGEDSFEDLFMKLRDMKDHAATLPHEERKSYAEQVAVAFWKAMGGDDDEVSGLGLDESN